MMDSRKLLAEYAENGSESAFRELVTRYIDLIYSAALRMVDGDGHRAEDVTQTVFIDLARKASGLSSEVMLGGWLHRHTCFVAAKMMRSERRRQLREQHATEMNALQDDSGAAMAQLKPILDDAINRLGAEDRAAILLRFFERKDLRSVGEALGTSGNTARMRVSRALEKLQALLKRRGVAFSAAGLGAVLSAEAVTAAPAGLAATVGSAAVAATAAGVPILTLLKILTMTKIKFTIGALVIAGAATSLIVQHQAIEKMRADNLALQKQIAEMPQPAAALAGPSADELARADKEHKELLRLRSEAGRLRSQLKDLARLEAENRKLRGDSADLSAVANVRSDTWTNAGFDSALNALQTSFWSIHNTNIPSYKQSVMITDDARKFLDGLLPPALMEQARKRGWGAEEGLMFPMVAQDGKEGYTGYRVLSQDSTAPDQVTMSVALDMNSAPSQTNQMRFQQFPDGWKQVIDINDLSPDIRALATQK